MVQKSEEAAAAPADSKNAAVEPPPTAPPPVPLYAWGVLAALFLVYVNNQWSRSLVFYVVNFKGAGIDGGSLDPREFMNIDLGFDQQAYALLASFGFTLLYSACSLVAGRAVDVISRQTTAVASCVAWSLCTLGTGLASSFEAVLALRILQGVSQAFTTPAAYTLLQDYFPAGSRSTANSIYGSGVYLGGALASLSVLLNNNLGWRGTATLVGAIGLATAAAAAFVLREPPAAAAAAEDVAGSGSGSGDSKPAAAAAAAAAAPPRKSLTESLAAVAASRTAVLIMVASALRFCAGYSIGVWSAPFFRGAFPDYESQYAVTNALVVAGGGILSSIAGGFLSDRLAARDVRARAWVPAAGSLLAIPCWMGVVSGTSFFASMGFLLAEYLVAECWFGPTVSILQASVPADLRGTAQGAFGSLTVVGNLAPFVIGTLTSGGAPLRDVLFWAVPACYAASAIGFIAAGESVGADARLAAEAAKKES